VKILPEEYACHCVEFVAVVSLVGVMSCSAVIDVVEVPQGAVDDSLASVMSWVTLLADDAVSTLFICAAADTSLVSGVELVVVVVVVTSSLHPAAGAIVCRGAAPRPSAWKAGTK